MLEQIASLLIFLLFCMRVFAYPFPPSLPWLSIGGRKKQYIFVIHWVFLSLFLIPDAFDMAKLLCDKYYMASPDLDIQEVNGKLCLGQSGNREGAVNL